MPIGPAVRTRLGRFEIPAADLYRSLFINLEDCAELLASLVPARRILEIGCGDGSFAQRLLEAYPEAHYDGIDIAADPGRLFRGDADRVTFASISSSELLARSPDPYDLVVLVDVVHHVPDAMREGLLADMRSLTAEGGHYVIKDWDPAPTPAHWAAFAADRFVTGDDIHHISAKDLQSRLGQWFTDPLVALARVPPRRNNYLLAYRRDSGPTSS